MTADATSPDLAERLNSALAGTYTDLVETGIGATARVFRAFDPRHARPVALKVLRPEVAATLGAERFVREILVAARMQHPNIVAVFDSGIVDGLYFVAMPFIDGETLRARLKRERQLPAMDALRIARDVADALDYAHARDVVHRDIKPANILLSAGHAVVADFGLARALHESTDERLTATGLAVGTPEYMSPEQTTGEAVIDGRTDLYSLGCVLYEMLAGAPPFTAPSVATIIARHRFDAPAALDIVRPGMTPRVIAIVARALAKMPADRFIDATEFRDALDLALASATADRAALPPPRPRRRAFSRRSLVAAGLIAAAGLGALSIYRLWPGGTARGLDPRRVAVYPLHIEGGGTDRVADGEAIATYIGYALDGTEPLRWIDAWRRTVATPTAQSATGLPAGMLAAARAANARYAIDGVVLLDADSARVVLRLYDAAGDSLLQRAGAGGARSAFLPHLGLRAVTALLPMLLPTGGRIDVAALSDRSTAAVAHFLAAEGDYRRMRYAQSLDRYKRAVAADSSFALAALKGMLAAEWIGQREEQGEFMRILRRARSTLSPRYRLLGDGAVDYARGAADSAIATLRRAIAADSSWPEAWAMLGDVYLHLVPNDDRPLDRAREAFEGALRVDSVLLPARYWLAEIALFHGDTAPLARLLRERASEDRGGEIFDPLSLALSCVREQWPAERWSSEARAAPGHVLRAGKYLSTHAAYPPCARDALLALLADSLASVSDRWGAALTLNGLLVATNDHSQLVKLDSLTAAATLPSWALLLLRGVATGEHHETVQAAAETRGSNYERMSVAAQGLLESWYTASRQYAKRAPVAAALAASATRAEGRATGTFTRILEAHGALAEGDTARAILLLRRLRPTAPSDSITWEPWESLGWERLTLARLLAGVGEPAEALRVASSLDATQPVAYLLYLRASLELRSELARRVGRPALAESLLARLRALNPRGAATGTAKFPSRGGSDAETVRSTRNEHRKVSRHS